MHHSQKIFLFVLLIACGISARGQEEPAPTAAHWGIVAMNSHGGDPHAMDGIGLSLEKGKLSYRVLAMLSISGEKVKKDDFLYGFQVAGEYYPADRDRLFSFHFFGTAGLHRNNYDRSWTFSNQAIGTYTENRVGYTNTLRWSLGYGFRLNVTDRFYLTNSMGFGMGFYFERVTHTYRTGPAREESNTHGDQFLMHAGFGYRLTKP